MAIIKAVNSHASLAKAIRYITKNDKTDNALISGYNCRGTNALFEMKSTKRFWNKTDGRQYKHFIQSFSPDENISLSEAHEIAAELISRWDKFKGYEVCFATHFDKHHIHTHMIVNSVSFVDGKKFGYSKKDLSDFKNLSDEILLKHNKTVCKRNTEITDYSIYAYKAIAEAMKNGNEKSWLYSLMLEILTARSQAENKEDFIFLLGAKGIEVKWNDRKYITFTDGWGNKVRCKRLSEIFKVDISKEGLENEFKQNHRSAAHSTVEREIREREYLRLADEIKRREQEVSGTQQAAYTTERGTDGAAKDEHQGKDSTERGTAEKRKRSYYSER